MKMILMLMFLVFMPVLAMAQTSDSLHSQKKLLLKKQKGLGSIHLKKDKYILVTDVNNKQIGGLIHSFSDSSITIKIKLSVKHDSLNSKGIEKTTSIKITDIQAINLTKKDSGREIEGNLWLGAMGGLSLCFIPVAIVAGLVSKENQSEHFETAGGILVLGTVAVGQAYLAYKTTQPKTYDLKHKWKLVVK